MATTRPAQPTQAFPLQAASRLAGAALLVGLVGVLLVHYFGADDASYSPPTTPGDRAPVRVGERAPDFTLTDAQGNPVTLSKYRGQPVVLIFYRTFG